MRQFENDPGNAFDNNTVNNRGYTLVELMVATVVGMAIVAGATATFIVQNRSYTSTESISEVNSQSKTALDIIAKEIRLAGMGMDVEAAALGLETMDPSQDGGTAAADSITIMAGFNSIGTLSTSRLAGPFPVGSRNIIYMQDAERRIRKCPTGAGEKCWLNIDGVFFARVTGCTDADGDNVCTSPNDDAGIVLNRDLSPDFIATLTAVSDSNSDGQIDGNDTGRPVYGMINVTYFVNDNMELIRNNGVDDEAIAENIEDLQFAYGDANGVFVNGDAVTTVADIRAVRISLLARADKEDRSVTTEKPPVQLENRTTYASSNDGFRRRLWQSVVNLRNF